MFYLIIFCILLFFSILEVSNIDNGSKRILIIFTSLILILVAGLRYETGGDWNIYENIFHKIKPIGEIAAGAKTYSGIELGFVLFCSVIKQLGGNIQTVFFLITLLNIILITKSLMRYTKYVIFGLFVYYSILYFALEMLYTRQAIAVAISFFSLAYIKERKIIKYLLLIILAAFFHRMALVMIPLYFILNIRFSSVFLIVLFSIGCIFMIFQIPWMKGIFLSISMFLGDDFSNRALYYLSEERYSIARVISIGFVLNILLFVLILLFKNKIEKKEYGTIFINMFVLSLLIYCFGYELIEVGNRFRFFFFIGIIVIFPYITESLILYPNKLLFILLLSSYCFLYNRAIFLEKPEAVAYNPYQNYLIYKWNDKESTGKKRLKESIDQTSKERKEMKKR